MDDRILPGKLIAFIASLSEDEFLRLQMLFEREDVWETLRSVRSDLSCATDRLGVGIPLRNQARRQRRAREESYDHLVARVIDMVDKIAPSNQRFSEVAHQYFGITMSRVIKKSRTDLKGELAVALLKADRDELRALVRRLGTADTVPAEPSELERWFDLITGGSSR